jgi:S1-C subfamily serine protease
MAILKQGAAQKQVPPIEEAPPQPVSKPPRKAVSKTKQPATKVPVKSPSKKMRLLKIAVMGLLALYAVVGAGLFLIHKYNFQITRRDADRTSPIKRSQNVFRKIPPLIASKSIEKSPGKPLQETTVSKQANTPDTYETIGDLFNKENKATATVITYDSGHNLFKQGSGFFINKNGHFITCYHVLKGAYSASIKIEDQKEYEVDYVIAADEDKDLIKLAVNIPNGTLAPGMWIDINDKKPKVADRVMVISTPMGLSRTVSDGIISAIRELPGKGLVYQMTVPISPGSSGSPVIDMKGKVVGVSFLQLVSGQNLNFAIPSEFILDLKNEHPLTLASWTQKVSNEKVNTLKKLQETILLQIDPHKKTGAVKKSATNQGTKDQIRLKLAQQVVKESGIAKQSKSFSKATLASFEKKLKENLETKNQKSDEDKKRFEKYREVIKLATNPNKLNKYIEDHLASNLSIDELKEVLKWYESPLGKKIAAIEYSSISEKKEQFRKQRLAFNLIKYQSTGRLTLFERLDSATSETDAMIELQTNLIIQNQILELILSDSKMPNQKSIDEIVEKFRKNVDPYLDSLTSQFVFAGFVYTYRGVDTNDIEKYVLFSEESAAKHYYQVMNKQFNAYLLESHRRILTSIIRTIQNDSWNNIKKDLDQPIVG